MNDFSELEARLRGLRPIAPSEDLIARIERALAEATNCRAPAAAGAGQRWQWPWRVSKTLYRVGFGVAAAAATAAAVLLIYARLDIDHSPKEAPSVAAVSTTPTNTASAPVAAAEFVPAAFTEVVYNTRDEGLRFPAGPDQPMRRIRYQKQETIQWRNPVTGASLRVSYPTEEISLIRAPGQ
jgi:negative regulator of sigma E activity